MKITKRQLKRIIRESLKKIKETETEVLGEPDESSEEEREGSEEKDEQNTVASAAPGGMGPMTPLGTGPDGGKGKKNKNKSPRERAIDSNKRAWGGGEIYTSKRNKF